MLGTKDRPVTQNDNATSKDADEVIISSEKKITLSCGKSSITLYPNGKIVLKGDYILSDAEGVNRLSGGRIDIN
jgi:regulator of RNase E activity RraA